MPFIPHVNFSLPEQAPPPEPDDVDKSKKSDRHIATATIATE
jgi:hypothetical protein